MNGLSFKLTRQLIRLTRASYIPITIRQLHGKTGIKPSTPQSNPFVKAFKYFAIGLLSIGCFKIFPYVGEFTVANAVGLLDSKDSFFVKVGLRRIIKSVKTEQGAKLVLDNEVIEKCVRILKNQETDQSQNSIPLLEFYFLHLGVLSLVMDLLEVLCEFECVQGSFIEEGALLTIEQALKEGRLQNCENQIHSIRWIFKSPNSSEDLKSPSQSSFVSKLISRSSDASNQNNKM